MTDQVEEEKKKGRPRGTLPADMKAMVAIARAIDSLPWNLRTSVKQWMHTRYCRDGEQAPPEPQK